MNLRRQFLTLSCVTAIFFGISAQSDSLTQHNPDKPSVKIDLDMRADFTAEHIHQTDENPSGFHGRYLNLHINGQITKGLTYSLRQRLNKFQNIDNDVFSATDWAYLRYQPVPNFAVSAGKQVVLIGGYEYDAAPIDVYFASRFWNNIACFQFGASASYISDNGLHELTAQVTNSPYQGLGSACYAYNLYWAGNMNWFHTLWSANLIEYSPGNYATFIALGNHFTLGRLDLQLDVMNRHTKHQKYWFADYSLIAQAKYDVTPWCTVMAKGGKDDIHPLPGAPERVDKAFWGAGFEFYPFKNMRNVRLHALYDVYHDNDGIRYSQINIGLKWRINLLNR